MRSAEPRALCLRLGAGLLVLAAFALGGCAGTSPGRGEGAASALPATPAMTSAGKEGGAPNAAGATPTGEPIDAATRKAFNDARTAMLTGHADRAEKGFLALTQSRPEFGGPFANLGILYRQAGKLPESAVQLEQAVRLGPTQPSYFNELGITYRMQGSFTKARAAYEQAIEIDPTYPAAVLNLAILHDIYLWEPPRALELYERYMALAPDGDERVAKWATDLRNRQRSAKKKEAQ